MSELNDTKLTQAAVRVATQRNEASLGALHLVDRSITDHVGGGGHGDEVVVCREGAPSPPLPPAPPPSPVLHSPPSVANITARRQLPSLHLSSAIANNDANSGSKIAGFVSSTTTTHDARRLRRESERDPVARGLAAILRGGGGGGGGGSGGAPCQDEQQTYQ